MPLPKTPYEIEQFNKRVEAKTKVITQRMIYYLAFWAGFILSKKSGGKWHAFWVAIITSLIYFMIISYAQKLWQKHKKKN
jgi:uncharacterized membrane protein YjjP (DUF1212 family)